MTLQIKETLIGYLDNCQKSIIHLKSGEKNLTEARAIHDHLWNLNYQLSLCEKMIREDDLPKNEKSLPAMNEKISLPFHLIKDIFIFGLRALGNDESPEVFLDNFVLVFYRKNNNYSFSTRKNFKDYFESNQFYQIRKICFEQPGKMDYFIVNYFLYPNDYEEESAAFILKHSDHYSEILVAANLTGFIGVYRKEDLKNLKLLYDISLIHGLSFAFYPLPFYLAKMNSLFGFAEVIKHTPNLSGAVVFTEERILGILQTIKEPFFIEHAQIKIAKYSRDACQFITNTKDKTTRIEYLTKEITKCLAMKSFQLPADIRFVHEETRDLIRFVIDLDNVDLFYYLAERYPEEINAWGLNNVLKYAPKKGHQNIALYLMEHKDCFVGQSLLLTLVEEESFFILEKIIKKHSSLNGNLIPWLLDALFAQAQCWDANYTNFFKEIYSKIENKWNALIAVSQNKLYDAALIFAKDKDFLNKKNLNLWNRHLFHYLLPLITDDDIFSIVKENVSFLCIKDRSGDTPLHYLFNNFKQRPLLSYDDVEERNDIFSKLLSLDGIADLLQLKDNQDKKPIDCLMEVKPSIVDLALSDSETYFDCLNKIEFLSNPNKIMDEPHEEEIVDEVPSATTNSSPSFFSNKKRAIQEFMVGFKRKF